MVEKTFELNLYFEYLTDSRVRVKNSLGRGAYIPLLRPISNISGPSKPAHDDSNIQ